MVEVCWIDSATATGWTDRQSELDNPKRWATGRCRSVGYVIEDTAEALVLVQSVSGNDNVMCVTTIPTSVIVERHYLAPIRDAQAAGAGEQGR